MNVEQPSNNLRPPKAPPPIPLDAQAIAPLHLQPKAQEQAFRPPPLPWEPNARPVPNRHWERAARSKATERETVQAPQAREAQVASSATTAPEVQKHPPLVMAGLICLAGTLLLAATFWSLVYYSKDIKGVRPSDYRRLTQLPQGRAELSFDAQGKELWLALPSSFQTKLKLQLTSVDGQVLTERPIHIQAQALASFGQAHFNQLFLRSGDRVAPGTYQYEIQGEITDPLYHLLVKIGQWKPINPLVQKLLAKAQPQFNLRGMVSNFSGSTADFQASLANYFKQLKERDGLQVQALKETFQTLISLLARTEALYKDELMGWQRGEQVQSFERNYALQIAPILQSYVYNNRPMPTEEAQLAAGMTWLSHPDLARSHYSPQEVIRAIGIAVTELIDKTQKLSVLSAAHKKELRQQLELKIRALTQSCQQSLLALDQPLR